MYLFFFLSFFFFLFVCFFKINFCQIFLRNKNLETLLIYAKWMELQLELIAYILPFLSILSFFPYCAHVNIINLCKFLKKFRR